MSILPKLASSLNRRDEEPNTALAKQIADKNNKKAVAELFEHLKDKDKGIPSDCIKVIYEVGKLKPALISPFVKELISILDHKNNRLQWGAMTALNNITEEKPAEIYAALSKIIRVADEGSVITNDHCVNILIKLGGVKKYSKDAFDLLNERILISPPNQLPTYAELTIPLVTEKNKTALSKH